MSKISLSPSPTGSAVYTIASPAGSTDRTLTIPDSAGTIATAESTLAQFNVTGSAPVFACRAFVNFNGTGTPAIRASGNVSSIEDGGTGNYTVNFTTAMPDANYAWAIGIGRTSAENGAAQATTNTQVPLAGSLKVNRFNEANVGLDEEFMCVTIFR